MRSICYTFILLLILGSCAMAESVSDCLGVIRVFGDTTSWTSTCFVVGDGSYVLTTSDSLIETIGPETTQTIRYPIFISAYNGRAYPCELKSIDKKLNLAILKLQSPGLPAAQLAKIDEFSKAALGTLGQLTGDDMVGNAWPTDIYGIASVKIDETRRLGISQWSAKKVFVADMGKSRWLFLSDIAPQTSPPNGSLITRGTKTVGMYVKKLVITGGRVEFVYGMCAMSPEIVKYLSGKGISSASLYDPPKSTIERPADADAAFALQAAIYSRLGANKPLEAMAYAEAVSKMRPDDAQARMVLGLTKVAAGKPDEALKAYDEAFAIDPKLPALRANKAALLIAQNKTKEAEAELIKACEEFPGDVRVLTAMADFYLGDEKTWSKALGYAQRAVAGAPDSPATQLLLGRVQKRNGDYKSALVAIGEATKMAPNWAEAWFAMGSTCEASGDMTAAESAYRKYVEKAPNDPVAMITLASFLSDMDRKEEAKGYLDKIRALNPSKEILDAVQSISDAINEKKQS